jgi:hypothetical protein
MKEDEAKLKEIKDWEAEQAELHREQRMLG